MAVVDDLGQQGTDSPPPPEDFGRQPPQDLAAEQSVLGGMLLSKDAIADVLERLRPGDFYRPAHQNVYDAILDLYGRGEPADAVTVSAELDRRGLLRRIGGAPYLHTLISTVPTAANAGYYAGIVAEKALLRRLVEAGTRVVQYGYAGAEGADVNEIVDRAQAEIYDVTERRTAEDFVALETLLQPTMDEIDAIASGGGISRGVPTGFTELDEVTNGLHPGQMIVVAARPGVGKSTLGLDFLRSCSIKNRMASVVFSLEMSKTEIVMRLLSAEAKIKLADMRSGRMSDDDWTRLARRMSEISEAPLYIDDSPNLTMMEIRAKARRLAAEVRPSARRDRLPAADDLGQEGRVPPAGSLGILPAAQAFGQGARGSGGGDEPAEPRSGAAHRQEADAVRPSRVGSHRAGRRHGDPAAPPRCLRARRSTWRRGGPDSGQAPQRSDEDDHRCAPAAFVAVYEYGAVAASSVVGSAFRWQNSAFGGKAMAILPESC